MTIQGRDDDVHPALTPHARPPTARLWTRLLWLAAAIAAAFLLVWTIAAHAAGALALLFVAIVLAEGLRPLVSWLHAHGLPRPFAVLLLYLFVLGGLGALLWALLSPLLGQLIMLVNAAPSYLAEIEHLLRRGQSFISHNPQASGLVDALIAQANSTVSSLMPLALNAPFAVVDVLFKAIQILLVAFFWLTATDGLRAFALGLLPIQAQPAASRTLAELSSKLGGYVRGVFINMVLIGVLSGGGLALLGVPYPLLLGLLAGLAETLPFLGPWISGAPAVLAGFAAGGALKAGEVILLYVLIQQVEGNLAVPLVMTRSVDLNPLGVIVGVLIGGALFGLVGAVLGVPAAVVVQVLVVEVLAPVARTAAARVSARAPVPRPLPIPSGDAAPPTDGGAARTDSHPERLSG